MKPQDKFLIIASDGLWDVFSNKDAVQFIVPFWEKGDPCDAAEALAKEARARWEISQTIYIDDITVVIVFLEAS